MPIILQLFWDYSYNSLAKQWIFSLNNPKWFKMKTMTKLKNILNEKWPLIAQLHCSLSEIETDARQRHLLLKRRTNVLSTCQCPLMNYLLPKLVSIDFPLLSNPVASLLCWENLMPRSKKPTLSKLW